MKLSELLERLKQFDPDCEVVTPVLTHETDHYNNLTDEKTPLPLDSLRVSTENGRRRLVLDFGETFLTQARADELLERAQLMAEVE